MSGNGRALVVEFDTAEVMQALGQMQQRMHDLSPFLGAVGMIMIKSSHENFEKEGRPNRWKGWAPLTRKIYEQGAADAAMKTHKTKAGRARQTERNLQVLGTRKILQNDGELKKSIVLGPITNDSVTVGSSLVYARIHQLGGVIKPKKAKALFVPAGGGKILKLKEVTIPARPFLMLQESDYWTISRIAKDYILRGEIG